MTPWLGCGIVPPWQAGDASGARDGVGGSEAEPAGIVVDDEAQVVHGQGGREIVVRAFVEIGVFGGAGVALPEWLHAELRDAEPGGGNLRALAHGQVEAADGQRVGGRGDLDVDVFKELDAAERRPVVAGGCGPVS